MTKNINFFHQLSVAAIMMTLLFMEHIGKRNLVKLHKHLEVEYLEYEESTFFTLRYNSCFLPLCLTETICKRLQFERH